MNDVSSFWVSRAGPQKQVQASADPRLDQQIVQVVRSAAEGTDCPVAVFYLDRGAHFETCAFFGTDKLAFGAPKPAIMAQIYRGSVGTVLTINDTLSEPGFDPADALFFSGQESPFRFFAAIQIRGVSGKPKGVLVVADPAAHAGLSAAQTYVLMAHAAQLSLFLEVGALQDALEDSRTSRQSSSSAERLRLLESVVVNANDAVLITEAEPFDLPGPRIVYCNAAFTRTTGYTEAEVLGLTPRILQSPKTNKEALARLRGALSRWEPIEVELLNCKKDGTEFYVELSIVPVADGNGWFTHWVSVQRDVSERKQAEETRLHARLAEAENRVLEAEIRERKLVEAKLLYAAFHDDLTKLRNRAFFMDRLGVAIGHAKRKPDFRYAVLFMDLDRFKLVNDSLGHRAGDLLLMELASRMRGCIRPQDTLARIGGDEFALLIEDAPDIDSVSRMAERLIEAVSLAVWLGKQEVFPSCSVGLVHITNGYDRAEDLLRDADIAMYRSKRLSPGLYTVFSNQMSEGAVEALELETDLRNAVGRDEFFLVYQPVRDAATGFIVGLEALIRWSHPKRGLVPPAGFIGAAEETGLIRDIGRWVLREACTQMRQWHEQFPGTPLWLCVNTSGVELNSPRFRNDVQATLEATGMTATKLHLEITESIFIEQPEIIGQILEDIRNLGVRIALDDFGTGYSSLSYLDRYPMDVVKVDRSFVASMLSRPRTLAIVRAVVSLAAALDLDVIAEGVEEESQLRVLRDMGCGCVQGYLLGQPSSPADIEFLLLNQERQLR